MRAISIYIGRLQNWPVVPILLWICLWLNLDSGFWNLQLPESADDWQLLIRAVLPFAVLPLAGFLLLGRRQIHLAWSGPTRLLLVYGVIATFATAFSPEPWISAYWSIAFLATVCASLLFPLKSDPVGTTRLLLQITWAATFIVAGIIAYRGGDLIFGSAASAYGIEGTLNDLSRSSGVARWAAIPGLVCIVRAFHTPQKILLAFYLGVAGVSFYIVYRMQSRGAIFGAVAALVFILLISSRMRRYALPFAAIAVVCLVLIATPERASSGVVTYLMRGQSSEEFQSMTGRTRAYSNGLEAFADAPVFGRGQWADRMTIGEHVHNSFLQAMLNGGAMGALPYLGSWIAGWLLFLRLHKRNAFLAPEDLRLVLECGTVMMFFSVRAIPETTTASFSVDLLVMVAVFVYLESLWIAVKNSRRWLVMEIEQPVILSPVNALALGEEGVYSR